jgi:hypothetical protein
MSIPILEAREELRDFVQAAHDQGIYIILDVIAHHTGNVFAYNPDRYSIRDPNTGQNYYDPRWDGNRGSQPAAEGATMIQRPPSGVGGRQPPRKPVVRRKTGDCVPGSGPRASQTLTGEKAARVLL